MQTPSKQNSPRKASQKKLSAAHEAAIALSPEDFANLGAPLLAYIHPVQTPQGMAYGIFAANGQPVGLADRPEAAFGLALENELTVVSLH